MYPEERTGTHRPALSFINVITQQHLEDRS
jgi:hypothetical protein